MRALRTDPKPRVEHGSNTTDARRWVRYKTERPKIGLRAVGFMPSKHFRPGHFGLASLRASSMVILFAKRIFMSP